MFKKILIANRGEIACRVIKTARKMGIATVAVYSEADQEARHVQMADEAVCIGPPSSKQSYLLADKIIEACKQTGAEAVHPGYGFLSENAGFAERLEKEGIVFIGPKHYSIAAMGDKIESKKLAMKAGVNTIPGWNDAIEDPEKAVKIANDIGYPVMLKASAGGGGKGLRVAFNDEQCRAGLESCRNEARNAFGDDRVFIEKFVEEPRHIEIQVLGDSSGNIVYLWERECSIQRRHQKVIEEAPSPFLDPATRKAMGEQAVKLASAVRYESAGTVEFVVGKDRNFYFLEMNTRLQVEHPVTEMITGLDLVELMIRVAAGEKLPFSQEEVKLNGWAMECRINAEDPFRNFLPSTGRLVRFIPPEETDSAVRVDTGVYEGGEISMFYDSMIAKLITHGATRDEAIANMRGALGSFVIRGVSSNVAFQTALMYHPKFISGDFNTGFIAQQFPDGFHRDSVVHSVIHDDPLLLASVAAFGRLRYISRAVLTDGRLPGHDRKVGTDWVVLNGKANYSLAFAPIEGGYEIVHGDRTYQLKSDWKLGQPLFRGSWNGQPICLELERLGVKYRVAHRGTESEMMVLDARSAELLALMPYKPPPDLSKFLVSPMPGLLTQVAVKAGQEVRAGEKLVVIEAMKMENILSADQDCVVAEVMVKQGESLAVDQTIIRFE